MVQCCGSKSRTKQKYTVATPPENNNNNNNNKREILITKKAKKFKYGGPTKRGNAFPLLDDGICFRVENGKKWFIYNDTLGREIHLTMRFPLELKIKPHKRISLTRESNGWVANIIVYPLETVPFLTFNSKKVNCLFVKTSAKPLSQEYLLKIDNKCEKKLQEEKKEVLRISSKDNIDEEKILYKCRKKKLMYIDLNFSPDKKSLQRPTDKRKIVDVSQIKWKRTIDYVPEERHKDIQLFCNGINPQDIDQGQLGDCWLMCALSVLAGRPFIIKALFNHPISSSKAKKERKYGGYRVSINKHGWWENIIVDNYLPTLRCKPIFAMCAEDPCELWVSIIEKAYAKLHGSYAAIIGGDAMSALQDITGFPIYSFETLWPKAMQNAELASQFFKTLRRFKKKGYMITLGTPGKDTSPYTGETKQEKKILNIPTSQNMQLRYEKAGLGMGHAYSVLDIRQFHFPNIKLLKIRNPWGSSGSEWTGAWSDASDKWRQHPLVRHSCKFKKENDGTFWMEWNDIIQYFDGGGVCMIRKNWFDYRFAGSFFGITPNFVLQLYVKRKITILLILSQRDRRALSERDPDSMYKGLLINIAHYNKKNKQYMRYASSSSDPENPSKDTFTYNVRRDVSMELTLLPEHSPYIIIPRIMANSTGVTKYFTLGLLTPHKIVGKNTSIANNCFNSNSGLQVNFKAIPSTHVALKNQSEYTLGELEPQSLKFQYKKPGKTAVMREGISIHEANKI